MRADEILIHGLISLIFILSVRLEQVRLINKVQLLQATRFSDFHLQPKSFVYLPENYI